MDIFVQTVHWSLRTTWQTHEQQAIWKFGNPLFSFCQHEKKADNWLQNKTCGVEKCNTDDAKKTFDEFQAANHKV